MTETLKCTFIVTNAVYYLNKLTLYRSHYCRYTVTACPLVSWPLHCPYTAVYSSICTVMYTIVYTAEYGP